MNKTYNLTINDMDNYLKRIFALENQLVDKDLKIMMLEFELKIEKNLLSSMKRIYNHPISKDK